MLRKLINNTKRKEIKLTRAHIIQSTFAGIYIFMIFGAMHSLQSELAVASLGASAFICFSFPLVELSRPRYLIGGYLTGAIVGLLFNWMSTLFPTTILFPSYVAACALAVFLSMMLMTVFNFEHPPSAALAVAVAMDSHPFMLSIAGLGCIIVLCVFKEIAKRHMRNL